MEKPPIEEEPLDEKWYRRFLELYFEDYEFLGGNTEERNRQEELFLNGEVKNPILDYPLLDKDKLDELDKKFSELKADLLEQEENEVVRQAYRWRINEMLAGVRMLKAAEAGDDKKFSRYSEFIYGKPSPEIFRYDMDNLKSLMDKARESGDDEQKKAAEELEQLINWGEVKKIEPAILGDDLPEKGEDEGEPFTAEQIKEMFDEAIKDLDLSNWQVVIDESGARANLSASQTTKTVYIPSNEQLEKRDPIFETKVRGLIAHELGVHAKRRENGERTKFHLLSLGLDRYLKGEEGVATYNQQLVEGDDEYVGIKRHMPISLAKGLDGRKRDFREVFEILKRYHILKEDNGENREKLVSQQAYSGCVRFFRGTSCQTPGAVFTKDIVYLEGNIGIWQLVNENSNEQHQFMVGKYDPTNSRHVCLIDKLLGTTDKELNNLDK